MKRLLAIIILVAVVAGCKNKNKVEYVTIKEAEKAQEDTAQPITTNETSTIQSTNELTEVTLSWADSLVKMYMAFSENNLIKEARKEKIPEEWVYDNTINTDSAVFDTYRIGHDVADEDSTNVRYVTDQWVYIDTATHQLYEYNVLTEKLDKWWTVEDMKHFFYPVYELSPQTTAFAVNFREDVNRSILDTLFEKYCPEQYTYDITKLPRGWKIYDTSGIYQLMKSAVFERAARKYYDKEFYVYGTNGYVKTRFKDIVFGLDECKSSIIAFCFDNASIKSIGHPVFCSTRLINLAHAADYSNLEDRIDNYLKNDKGYFLDGARTKVLGHIGNLYFTYWDDFLWNRKVNGSKYKFPNRCVYMIDDRNIERFWKKRIGLVCN
jgi:hypothetical protein